jgi:hypothetical protein
MHVHCCAPVSLDAIVSHITRVPRCSVCFSIQRLQDSSPQLIPDHPRVSMTALASPVQVMFLDRRQMTTARLHYSRPRTHSVPFLVSLPAERSLSLVWQVIRLRQLVHANNNVSHNHSARLSPSTAPTALCIRRAPLSWSSMVCSSPLMLV